MQYIHSCAVICLSNLRSPYALFCLPNQELNQTLIFIHMFESQFGIEIRSVGPVNLPQSSLPQRVIIVGKMEEEGVLSMFHFLSYV